MSNDTGQPAARHDPIVSPPAGVRRVGAVLLILLSTGCGTQTQPPRPHTNEAARTPPADTRDPLAAAIDRSARYLTQACGADGKFTYCIHLDPAVQVNPQYNVLRHAGAVYALAQYNQVCQDAEARRAMLRAARFLWEECAAPVAGNPQLVAIWSEPELSTSVDRRQAKLGGTGLGLAALLAVEQIEPGFTPQNDLRKLGRFLIFMQKSDGSFYSKYFLDTGRSDLWQSMYYPGEAALGLIMFYELDRSEQWLRSASKALDHLARRGALQRPTLPDQWYLLAARRWFAQADGIDSMLQERVMEHARQLCRDMVQEQQQQLDDALIAGCFTPQGRTCPSATRLEGLLAALHFLPAGDRQLVDDVRQATHLGMQFLLESQVVEGPHAGALPRFKIGFHPSGVSAGELGRLKEVRIDYVQHALSAMIAYQQTFGSAPKVPHEVPSDRRR